MFLLGSAPSGWLDLLPGVRGRFDPVTRPMTRAARRAAADYIAAHPEMEAGALREAASDAFTAEMIRQGLREWEGISGPDGAAQPGDLVDVPDPDRPDPDRPDDPEARKQVPAIELFLADTLLVEAADAAWVTPWAVRAQEKNASSPSPAGTSAAATGAGTTAGSAAKPGRKGARKATAAGNARTAGTRRKPTKAKRSGKSSAGSATSCA